MKAKVCFNDEIHRISNVPEKLSELKELITSTFHNKLPPSWAIQYKDSDEDKIVISDENDFEEFKTFAEQVNKGSSIIKIYVVSIDNLKVSCSKSDVIVDKPEIEVEEEDYQIIEDSPESADEIIQSVESKTDNDLNSPIIQKPKLENKEENSPELKHCEPEKPFEEEEKKIDLLQSNKVLSEKLETGVKENEISLTFESQEKNIEDKVSITEETLEKMMSSAIEKSLPQVIQSSIKDKISETEKKENINKTIHYGYSCSRCSVMPIQGVRYQCSVCPGFNYCESCEENCPHIHHFVKIREYSPLEALRESENSRPKNIEKEKKPSQKKKFEPFKEEPKPHYAEKNDYFNSLKEKAQKLQKCFPKEEFEILLAYVNGAPEELSLEELVENFKH